MSLWMWIVAYLFAGEVFAGFVRIFDAEAFNVPIEQITDRNIAQGVTAFLTLTWPLFIGLEVGEVLGMACRRVLRK